MDAPLLRSVFDTAYLLALAAWLGSILFFSFGVAPIVFRVLDASEAARFLRALFPRYYAWGATCGALALPALLGTPLCFTEFRGLGVAAQAGLIVLCTLVMLYAGNVLTPAINKARDDGPDGKTRFDRLHRRGVRLNSIVMLILIGLIVAFVSRPAPTTTGIIEPSPQERAEREFEAYRRREAAYRDSLRTPVPLARPNQSSSGP